MLKYAEYTFYRGELNCNVNIFRDKNILRNDDVFYFPICFTGGTSGDVYCPDIELIEL